MEIPGRRKIAPKPSRVGDQELIRNQAYLTVTFRARSNEQSRFRSNIAAPSYGQFVSELLKKYKSLRREAILRIRDADLDIQACIRSFNKFSTLESGAGVVCPLLLIMDYKTQGEEDEVSKVRSAFRIGSIWAVSDQLWEG